MSADNGIYIAQFPDGTYRVAYGSDSVVSELSSMPWLFPPGSDGGWDWSSTVQSIWGDSPVFKDHKSARDYAYDHCNPEDTEYGVCDVELPYNLGEQPPSEFYKKPPLDDGACEFCSNDFRVVFHDKNFLRCDNPDGPFEVIRRKFIAETRGLSEGFLAELAVEALKEKGII